MVFETFIALVAFVGVAYAAAARYIQNRLVDRNAMEAMQADSRRLNDDMKKAREQKDDQRMEQLMKEQMELLPRMNKVMLGQFKPMIFILGIFFATTWMIAQVDPTLQDDITLNMSDDGKGCDAVAGDGTWSACYGLAGNANYGKWTATAHSLRGGAEAGANQTWFAYNADVSDNFTEVPKGEPIAVSTDRGSYAAGATVKLYATPSGQAKPDAVKAVLSNGTHFYVDLPMPIPILNVQRIQQPYWWFILVSFIASMAISVITGQLQKKKKADAKAAEKGTG
jgi:hypothetical protein